MSQTQAWRISPARTAGVPAPAAGGRGGHARRAGVRLWSLLHAQALLDATGRGPGDVTAIEDDRQRLAGRRAS